MDRSITTGRCHSAARWDTGNVHCWFPGAGQVRKKVGKIHDYEAKQSCAVVAKVVGGNGASDSIHVTLMSRRTP